MIFTESITNQKDFEAVAKMISGDYADDPTFITIFRGKSTLPLFKALLKYYNACENILVAREGDKVCGVILWNNLDDDVMNVDDMIKQGLLATTFRFLCTTSPSLLLRLIKWSNVTNRNHYRERSHYYLFMITVSEKGKGIGSSMMQELKRDKQYPIYLENLNIEDNSHFYLKSGFESLGRYKVFGVENERYLYIPKE